MGTIVIFYARWHDEDAIRPNLYVLLAFRNRNFRIAAQDLRHKMSIFAVRRDDEGHASVRRHSPQNIDIGL